MKEKVTITRLNTKQATRKDGTPVKTKNGHQMYSVGILTDKYGEAWINGLMPFNPDKWEGTEQELEIYEEEYNGKMYKKFKLPPRESSAGGSDKQIALLNEILAKVNCIKVNGIAEYLKQQKPSVSVEDPADEPPLDSYEGEF